MNEAVVQEPYYQAGFAGHGGMGSIPRELIAKNRVFGIIWATPNEITRVKIAHNERNFPRAKPFFDLIGQKQTDITQPDVPRRVAGIAGVTEKFLSRTFGDGNHCVPTLHYPLFQRSEKSPFPFQSERHLGDKREIHILACHGGCGSQESGVASHEFHYGDPVLHTACLSVRALQNLGGLLNRGEKAK